MRNTHSRGSRTITIPWKWLIPALMVIVVFLLFKSFGGESTPTDAVGLKVVPGEQSNVEIFKTESRGKSVDKEGFLASSDYGVSVTSGTAVLSDSDTRVTVDKGSEISYSGGKIGVRKGRAWIESDTSDTVVMKNFTATIGSGDIIIAEQQTEVYSILYVLQGSANIKAGDRSMLLETGKRIMISRSDLSSTDTTLESLSDDIGGSLEQVGLFISKNGSDVLSRALAEAENTPDETGSGEMIVGSGSDLLQGGNAIEVTSPTDGQTISTSTVLVSGKIKGDVKKVVINDTPATVSIVDQTFILEGYPIKSENTDLVIKAYDSGDNMIERKLISIKSTAKGTTEKLVPTNIPLGDNDFRISSPSSNPYKTDEDAITVRGTIPASVVSYITVNGYRLQQFKSGADNWYYYANKKYDTMKEGFNLYEIKFFGQDGKLLYTQAFTIIKESGTVVSGE